MPSCRVVLPYDGQVPTDRPEGEPGDVHLVVPSAEHVLVTSWLASVRVGAWESFARWWERVSAGDAEGLWRIDRQVLAWSAVAGSGHVRLVLGADGGADVHRLSTEGVRLVELLMVELERVGLTGRNAADMLHGAACGLEGGAVAASRSAPPLSGPLVERVTDWSTGTLDRVRAAGVPVEGDPTLLTWPVLEDAPEPAEVSVKTALDLAFGVLQRVRSWPGAEAAT